ncbi:hypothetical protein [Palaeococcus ferrophilus]|uniref:hypothetical protein n=1 Tax=Palaeococcus ferrophilus TaxID=83868 RepID=UPI00064F252E|nr:hypothetical protein [Palaeococcus ferrophilus]
MRNTELLAPKERVDSLILIGVREKEQIEFVKVYALGKDSATELLSEFFNDQGLLPTDFVVVDHGFEDVSEKGIISTKTEEELSAYLARMGLKLFSNGVFYVGDLEKVYQITAISKELYESLKRKKREEVEERPREVEEKEIEPYIDLNAIPPGEVPKKYVSALGKLNLKEDTLIINEAGIDLEKVLASIIKGQVLIPRQISIEDEIIVRIFDPELHREVQSKVDRVLVKTPVIFWDYYLDTMEEFEFKKQEEFVYTAPIFLKATRGFLVLLEPPVELVKKLQRLKKRGYVKFYLKHKQHKIPVDFIMVVETTNWGRYSTLNFPVTINLPRLDEDTWVKLLQGEFDEKLPLSEVRRLPAEYRTMVAFKNIKKLHQKLKERHPDRDELQILKEVIDIMIGEE